MVHGGFLSITKLAPTSSAEVGCLDCLSGHNYISGDFDAEQAAAWSRLTARSLSLASGKALFDTGSVVNSVYSVKHGCIKTFTLDTEGNERVHAFYLSGDMIGLDTLAHSRYPMYAIAVVPTQVSAMPRIDFRLFAQRTPRFMDRLVDRLSHSLHDALSLAGEFTTDQRVAAFLYEMEFRLAPLPSQPLRLPMGRRDIANYLRMATETVSRTLRRFEQSGLLEVRNRNVLIRNRQALMDLAEPMASWELMVA